MSGEEIFAPNHLIS